VAEISSEQREVCRRLDAEPVPAPPDLKVGIASGAKEGDRPIKAIRHLPRGDTTGWFIWGGDAEPAEQGDDFFRPLHVAHLTDWCPEILPYLALPPGWGVIVDTDYEDAWYDPSYLVD